MPLISRKAHPRGRANENIDISGNQLVITCCPAFVSTRPLIIYKRRAINSLHHRGAALKMLSARHLSSNVHLSNCIGRSICISKYYFEESLLLKTYIKIEIITLSVFTIFHLKVPLQKCSPKLEYINKIIKRIYSLLNI